MIARMTAITSMTAALVLLTGCESDKDASGREITGAEKAALATCNKELQATFDTQFEPFRSDQVVFKHSYPDELSVSWNLRIDEREMLHICFTDSTGLRFLQQFDFPRPQPATETQL